MTHPHMGMVVQYHCRSSGKIMAVVLMSMTGELAVSPAVTVKYPKVEVTMIAQLKWDVKWRWIAHEIGSLQDG